MTAKITRNKKLIGRTVVIRNGKKGWEGRRAVITGFRGDYKGKEPRVFVRYYGLGTAKTMPTVQDFPAHLLELI